MGYPQWIYHRTEEPRVIDSDDLLRHIDEGWATTPAAFTQSKKERELRGRLSALEKEALEVMDEINRLRKEEADNVAGSIQDPAAKARRPGRRKSPV